MILSSYKKIQKYFEKFTLYFLYLFHPKFPLGNPIMIFALPYPSEKHIDYKFEYNLHIHPSYYLSRLHILEYFLFIWLEPQSTFPQR